MILHDYVKYLLYNIGVNIATKGVIVPDENESKKYIEIRIRTDVDWNKSTVRKMRTKDYMTPFTVDLVQCRQVQVLKCHDICEFGAIALGGEIIKGVCGRITHLDLYMCGIHTRGLSTLICYIYYLLGGFFIHCVLAYI